MGESEIRRKPDAVVGILGDTEAMGFNMVSEPKVGSLLAVLAAAKPGGRLLELGTGTGKRRGMAPCRNGCGFDTRYGR